MIPYPEIQAWREIADWPRDDQVEQDLIISAVLVKIFSYPSLKGKLAFRGGTALNKLYPECEQFKLISTKRENQMNYEEPQDGEQLKQNYLTKVNQLFGDIKNWLKDTNLHVEQQETKIAEVLTGDYLAPTLSISINQEKLAKIVPIGACIIEAEGRIDVEGWLGIEHIAYLINGGPRLGAGRKMFPDVNCDGWYWLENNLSGRAHLMSQSSFLNVFTQATDYAF